MIGVFGRRVFEFAQDFVFVFVGGRFPKLEPLGEVRLPDVLLEGSVVFEGACAVFDGFDDVGDVAVLQCVVFGDIQLRCAFAAPLVEAVQEKLFAGL